MSLPSALIHRFPVHYGYVVALVALLGCTSTGPGQASTLGTVSVRIASDFDVSMSFISNAWLVATVTAALCLPLLGKMVDVLGPRKVFLLTVAGTAGGSFFLSRMESSWQLVVGYWALRVFANGGMW